MAGSAEKRLKKLAKKSDKKLEKMTKFINKKSEKAIKKHLKNKKKEAKKAALEAAPGTSKLEKRLNIAGAKARARKADRQESKKLRKEGPLQQTSRKIEMPKTEVKVNSPGPKKIQTKEKSFSETFKENRKMLGPGKTFTWKGKKYTTNLKEKENKAKHGGALAIMIAPVKSKIKKVKTIKKGAKAQDGATVPPSDFEKAFAKAIQDGVSTFEFEGKTYDARKKGEIYGDKMTRIVNLQRQKYRASDEYKQKKKEELKSKEERKKGYEEAYRGHRDPSDFIGNIKGMSFDLETDKGYDDFYAAKKKYDALQKLKKQSREDLATRQDKTRVNLPTVKLKRGGYVKAVKKKK